jgi:hypothetical protein
MIVNIEIEKNSGLHLTESRGLGYQVHIKWIWREKRTGLSGFELPDLVNDRLVSVLLRQIQSSCTEVVRVVHVST